MPARMPVIDSASARHHGRIVASRFKAHPLLVHAHQQTIAPALLRPLPQIDLRMERIETPDDDFIDLGWAGDAGPGSPIAVLVHGLGGGLQSKYLRGLARGLQQRGWRSALLQLRGGGAQPNRQPCTYHHGDTRDLRLVLHRLRERDPAAPIALMGWSMGGNIVLRALAEEGDAAPVAVAVAASVPFRLRECAEQLDIGFARVYQRYLLTGLKALVSRKHAASALPGIDMARVMAARNFIDFDNAFTAPLNGFADADDYYARTACGSVLHDIRVPTLIVHASDDPFMRPAIVPTAEALAPSVTLELARNGGHVGFIGRGPLGGLDWWLERRVVAHFEAALGRTGDTAPVEGAGSDPALSA